MHLLNFFDFRAIDGLCRNLKDVNDDRKIFLASKLEIFFDGIFPLIGQFQNTVLGLLLETLSSMISVSPIIYIKTDEC